MSRYDGLIIPRSYNEYINKTDPVAMSQALQLSGVLSGAVAAGDNKAVKSSAVYEALTNATSHNIPRLIPKDITSYVTDGTLWKRLAGTDGYALFEDIYVGDYFKMSRPISA